MDKEVGFNEKKLSTDIKSDRRVFMKGAAAALGVSALGAFAPSTAQAVTLPPTPPSANLLSPTGALNRIITTKKIKFGVDLGFAPLQYKLANGTPTGYCIELSKKLAASLGAEPEWVETPFATLFAAQAAGKFDISGICATIKPERAQKVLFAGAPTFVESNVVLLAPKSKIKKLSDLNNSSITIAVVVGSSQEAAAKILYPKAQLKRLENQAALADVSSGRSSCMVVGEFSVAGAVKANPGVTVLKGNPVFVDENSYFMPLGDYELKEYVDTWLRYETSHNELGASWDKFVGDDARKLGLQSVSLNSPWKSA